MDKSKKITIGLYALSIFLILGISYAYFSLNIIGNDTAKLSVISSGTLELTYSDTNEITLNNAVPGDSFQKEISIKNTGTLDTMYNIIWQELTNEFVRNELVISATCERLNSEGIVDGTCNNIEEKPVGRLSIPQKISIEPNITHKYTVTVKFIDTGENQNYNQNKSFDGKLGIEEYKDNSPAPTYCTFDGEMVQGAEYTNGGYTYRYMQENVFNTESVNYEYIWQNITTDGWGVTLTNKYSMDPVTSTLCTYINNKPVVSMSYMFSDAKADSLDLSSFNTKNVTNMSNMFNNVRITGLDLSNFDTSNVTTMNSMFGNNQLTALNISSFDTSKVTDMSSMFGKSRLSTIELNNFDTSSVINMSFMFSETTVTSINISNFDTSNVIDMSGMFRNSSATTLDLSGFDTRSLKYMVETFSGSGATIIDLSNFDTSNVENMYGTFMSATKLKTIYASDKYSTMNVMDGYSTDMFNGCTSLVGGSGTTYDSTKTDKTYARIDGGSSSPGYFTSK